MNNRFEQKMVIHSAA